MSPPLTPLPFPDFESPHLLHEGEVHLWLLDLRKFNATQNAEAMRIMNAAERERADKFIRGKEMHIASRWLQRKTLARYTGLAPAAVEFARTDKGKPYLPNSHLKFSLSHSGHWALLAIGRPEFIGVDVEAIGSTRDLDGIAENYYHPHEATILRDLPEESRADYFYRLWTLKEAFLKATGDGISAGLEKIRFELAGNNINAHLAESFSNNTDEWQFHQWALTAQDYCALAYRSSKPLLAKWFDALDARAFP